jgi:hypothetical protein
LLKTFELVGEQLKSISQLEYTQKAGVSITPIFNDHANKIPHHPRNFIARPLDFS